MRLFTCKTMRHAIMVAASFLTVGIGLFLVYPILPQTAYLNLILLLIAFLLMLLAPVVLVATWFFAVLPGAKKDLDQCEH